MSAEIIEITPFEVAFEKEVKKRGSSLGESSINELGQLIRMSKVISLGDNSVVFAYTRQDPLRSHPEYVLSTLSKLDTAASADSDGRPDDSSLDKVWEEVYTYWDLMMKDAGKMLPPLNFTRKRIEKEGGYNTYQALTNPNYLIPNARLIRWPEWFKCAVFFPDNRPGSNEAPEDIAYNSSLVHGVRADILLNLIVGPEFEGVINSDYRGLYENNLVINYPRIYHQTVKAYLDVYSPTSLKTVEMNNLDVTDVNWFPGSKPLHTPIHLGLYSPDKIMKDFTAFIDNISNYRLQGYPPLQ